jgi:hypothetical protein
MMILLAASTSTSDYLALASQCRSRNQFNRLHIALENILAPVEFGYFADLAARQQLPAAGYPWLVRIADLCPDLFVSPQPFGRRVLSENVLLYQDPSREAADKRLLVAFAGDGRRLMMPVAVFLQCLDSRLWDVVLLRKGPEKKSYLAGVEGMSRNFPSVIRYVESMTSAWRYQSVVTLGTSGGGFAAILSAILMNATRGISICGCPRQRPPGFWLRLQLAVHRARAPHRPEFVFAYGADHDADHKAALALQSSFGGRLRPVTGVGGHNILGALLARGELGGFLEEILA